MVENKARKNLGYYCESFANLKVQTKYQPILLLTIIDLISQNIIEENKILISDELLNKFKKYLNILNSESNKKPGLQYPFIALDNQKILHLEFKQGVTEKELTTINKSIKKLKQAVEYASLDEELFELIQDSVTRKELIDTLIEVWFSSAQKELEEILQINQSFEEEGEQELEDIETVETTRKTYLRKSLVRDSFFRKAVIHAYDYRCSLCQLRVIKSFTQSIVDGAHIKPFAQFYDNKINNGISLCKNHHWAFDKGIFSLDDNYQVIIADNFSEDSPNMKPIRDFQGENILLPNSERYFPNLEAIQWHRENIFRP
ncbi:HNH endonuclease [Crocosphaera sp. XPORK-15E]|uniref:HNH endonuclease n=1 Tax=Crocosphaera sp. XPORK-15E TaxID=3110247 RepID=UPI002B21082E|nr:HNH endonuclease [Crocosphaera sp. XPORK-15E]MEA5532447.1 HNH endonuclease [Crocosphaera sp. XPORK-15E]